VYSEGVSLDRVAPRDGPATGAPVVVTLHGCCGDRHDLTPLAVALAEEGVVVLNVSWRNANEGGGWPVSYQQAACALRFARGLAREEAAAAGGGPGRVAPGRVVVLGWSDGAMVAAVAALAGERLDPGTGCRAQAEQAGADELVAVAGFLGWPAGGGVPAEQVNERTMRFFGGGPEEAPAAWAGGNPYTYLDAGGGGVPAGVQVRLVAGSEDPLLGANACFAAAARAAGLPARLVVPPGAGPQTVIAPRTPEGRTVVAEVMAAARGDPLDPDRPADEADEVMCPERR
jgi:acetyl esterase/lipase